MTVISSGTWPINPATTSGTELAAYLNELVNAVQSKQASPSRPPALQKGGIWAKTLGAADISLMFYDGTTDHEVGSVTGGNISLGGDMLIASSADATINGLTVGQGPGGNNNTALGFEALQVNTAVNNTAQGYLALRNNTTGTSNTAVGVQALLSNTIGNSNTAMGQNALKLNTEGNNNTAQGFQALQSNTTGVDNTAVGHTALQSNTTGTNNIAVGRGALQANTEGAGNTAVGRLALLSNNTGANNTSVGREALRYNTTGSTNTAQGYQALRDNTTGIDNTAVGVQALLSNTTGSGNLGLAFRTSGGTYSPVFDPTTENNRLVMGHTGITNAYVQVAWTVVSDARDKTAFSPVPHGLDFVNSLKPTEYQFKENGRDGEADGIRRYGFLAQDVLELEGDNPVLVDDEDPDKLKLKESNLLPVLVNAIQELTAEVQTLKAQLEAK